MWCRDVHQLVLDAGMDAQNDIQLGVSGLDGAILEERETGSQESPEQSGCASRPALAHERVPGPGPQTLSSPIAGERSMLDGMVEGHMR